MYTHIHAPCIDAPISHPYQDTYNSILFSTSKGLSRQILKLKLTESL